MLELADPALEPRELVLLPDEALRGEPGEGASPPLAGRILVGGPHVLQLTPAELGTDPELARFAQAEAGLSAYYLIRLAVTFAPQPRRPRLEFAHVALELSAKPADPAPRVHAMDPVRVTDPVQTSRTLRLGPQLSLMGTDASLGELERSVAFTAHHPLVEALGLYSNAPAWEFRRTPAHELSGCHPLRLIVRAPADAVTEVSVTVSAGAKIPLLRRFTRRLPNPLRLETTL
ncbi:hypothetical protein [Streptomyces sp. NPDC049915]|uniref:hypothetical protein n=1 Tax=Streptomyces sp. NPDC049915 TaxID=3155510 RepID=UPI0034468E19